jgi:hypothetical protein
MTTYEHKLAIARPDQVLETCNELGAQGWELCGCYQADISGVSTLTKFISLVFKRAKAPCPTPPKC